LRIETDKRVDAECIAAALSKYAPQVEWRGDSWAVVTTTRSRAVIPVMLSAVKTCLDRETIPTVRVTIDRRTYLMEGAAKSA
jgi:hypothetical protein